MPYHTRHVQSKTMERSFIHFVRFLFDQVNGMNILLAVSQLLTSIYLQTGETVFFGRKQHTEDNSYVKCEDDFLLDECTVHTSDDFVRFFLLAKLIPNISIPWR